MQILKVTSENLHEAAEIYALSWRESHKELCSPAFLESKTLELQRAYLEALCRRARPSICLWNKCLGA